MSDLRVRLVCRNVPLSFGANASAAIECASLDATGTARGRPGSPYSSGHCCEPVLLLLLLLPLLPLPQVALVAAMDARVVVGAPAAEETPVAVATRGVATPSPVPSAPSTVVTITGTGNSGSGGGGGSSTAAATLASAPCTPQNPVVVVASPSSNHQQPTGVPRILSRNVNGTCKLSERHYLHFAIRNRKRSIILRRNLHVFFFLFMINRKPHNASINRLTITAEREFVFLIASYQVFAANLSREIKPYCLRLYISLHE